MQDHPCAPRSAEEVLLVERDRLRAARTVACMPSTVTAKVSGLTSIFGVPELRTMSRLPILRVFVTGITWRLEPEPLA